MKQDSHQKTQNFWVYIILTDKDTLYTGIAIDLKKRFLQHLKGPNGAKFFKTAKPLKIVYYQSFENRSLALKQEALIKKLTRKNKLLMIEQFSNPPLSFF